MMVQGTRVQGLRLLYSFGADVQGTNWSSWFRGCVFSGIHKGSSKGWSRILGIGVKSSEFLYGFYQGFLPQAYR